MDGCGLGSLLLPSSQFMMKEHLASDFGMTNTGALGLEPQLGIPFSIRNTCPCSHSACVMALTTGLSSVLANCTLVIAPREVSSTMLSQVCGGMSTQPADPKPLAASSTETTGGGGSTSSIRAWLGAGRGSNNRDRLNIMHCQHSHNIEKLLHSGV